MSAARYFYPIIGGFAVGVFFRSFVDLGFTFGIFFFVLGFFIFFYWLVQHTKILLSLMIFVVSVSLGIARFDLADGAYRDSTLRDFLGEKIELVGVVSDEPAIRDKSQLLVVDVESVGGQEGKDSGRMLVILEPRPRFSYGDRVVLAGALKKPESFETETGRIIDYPTYLAKDDIFYQMLFPEATLVSSGNGNPFRERLFDIKSGFIKRVNDVIPEPHASLLGGLVVGAQESMGDGLLEDFRKTGIIHIVVLSGYNVTIVAEAIMRILSFLPRVMSMSLGALSIILFAVMTGAGATIVRASIMALLVILARATGRTYDITRALFAAGFVMVLQNPKILALDLSFQLSFLATAGLIYLSPKIEKAFGWMPTKWQLREFATATISTQLVVLPLLLYKTGQLSLVSVPVNILILPFIPLTMLLGFVTGVVGFISEILSTPFAFVSYALLEYELRVVELFSSLPFSSLSVQTFPLLLLLVVYIVYLFLFYKARHGFRIRD